MSTSREALERELLEMDAAFLNMDLMYEMENSFSVGYCDWCKTSVLSNLVYPTHQESGCLHYELLQNNDDSAEFVLIEEWETQTALDRHTTASHTKTAQSKMESLMANSPPDVWLYKTVA